MALLFDYRSARHYEAVYQGKWGPETEMLQRSLVLRLLAPRPGQRLLDIGCGSGRHLSWLEGLGLALTGVDASPAMLERARQRLTNRVELQRAWAEHLPFQENEFDLTTMINTLEFVDDPARALGEAARVTRCRLLLGVMNKYALLPNWRRLQGMLADTIYRHAHHFSLWELKRLVHRVLGPVPLDWGTVQCLPPPLWRLFSPLEGHRLFQHNPFGALIVMSIEVRPRLIACMDPLISQVPGKRQPASPGTIRLLLPEGWQKGKQAGNNAI